MSVTEITNSQAVLWTLPCACGQRKVPYRARLSPELLSTFPQPHSSTAQLRLTSLFAESIHSLVHRTLALHLPGLAR
jgi:hypothetical protein